MKLKRYLVFGFKSVARLDGKGGWDDFLDSFSSLDEAVACGFKFLKDKADLDNPPKFQIVDLRYGPRGEVKVTGVKALCGIHGRHKER